MASPCLTTSATNCYNPPMALPRQKHSLFCHHHPLVSARPTSKCRRLRFSHCFPPPRSSFSPAFSTNPVPAPREQTYKVGNFMIKKEDLLVLKTTTTVDEALVALVEDSVTGFPVIDDDWKLVGVVSDYDILAIDSISGCSQIDRNVFPDVDLSWKTFNELRKILMKTHGKVVGDLMTPNPLVVHETTDIETVARLLLDTKYHRLPVVDSDDKLVGVIAREDVVKAALLIKRASERSI
uniref:CBS domain-containing protein n=1 Tax=Bruguiera gymnorhiza TaxID=39984 RepID=B1Q4U0_BRUGY|nr:hypothetical protein [Bruguiera gymnorhiza]